MKSEIIAFVISLMINIILIIKLTKESKLSTKLLIEGLKAISIADRLTAKVKVLEKRIKEYEEINYEVAAEKLNREAPLKNELEVDYE